MIVKSLTDPVVFVHLDFHLWTGRKKLRLEDLKADAAGIPPQDLASLGSKRICAPEELAPGERCRRRAERACELHGFRFLGHYALPEQSLSTICQELDGVVAEFQTWRAAFLARYAAVIQNWIGAHPGWEEIIRRAVDPVGTVAARLSAGYQVFRMTAPAPDQPEAAVNAGLTAQAATLGERLLQSVAEAALALWQDSLQGREQVTRRALRPLLAIQRKLEGWLFVDPVVAPIIQRIRLAQEALPRTGPIQGNDLNALAGLVFMLSDPQRMKQHGQAVLMGQPMEEAWPLTVERAVPEAEPTEDQEAVLAEESPSGEAPARDPVAPESTGPTMPAPSPAPVPGTWFF